MKDTNGIQQTVYVDVFIQLDILPEVEQINPSGRIFDENGYKCVEVFV